MLKRYNIFLFFTFLLVTCDLVTCDFILANNADVHEVSLISYDASASPKTVDVKFSLAQDNTFSGTDDNSQSYYDRVWIFVKYWKSSWATNHEWKHATLTTGGSVGSYSGGLGLSADGKGAFVLPGTSPKNMALGSSEWISRRR